ncbi:F-box/LRR-repeat protein 3 isoform X2 [Coffea arabica]|uniref:F-box/LRR-repeat protein 3 isoform X2 n=1 Tax=Coffea arabica TaxID=13443 RepID=A0A6P6UMG7_COFAR|nr:F-box/LRR-repeat protein 3-like isoform X2 [Coffea arabica]
MKNPRTMQQVHQSPNLSNPFENLTEEIIFNVLDFLDEDPQAKKSLSLVNKSFYSIESIHRRSLRPLRTNLIPSTLRRYPHLSHLDFTCCPRVEDDTLFAIADVYKTSLRAIDLSRSRFFSNVGLSSLAGKCTGLVEMDLSNATELTDLAAAAIAEAKNLEKLSLARCKLISDIGIGCIAVGCKKLKSVCLKWCLRVSDFGVGLIAMKCRDIRSLDLSYLPITEKCLPPILQLQQLKELVLVGCSGIDDEGLVTLNQGYKPLEMLNISIIQNVSHIGLYSLTNGMKHLSHLSLAYGFDVTVDLAKCLHNFPGLQCIKLDGCQVSCAGMKAIADCCVSLKEISLCKCIGVTDEGLSSIMEKHNGLKNLDITCCRKITHASLDIITSSCNSLISLKMESCSLIPEDAFELIGQRCSLLEELDITDNEVDDEGLKAISRCSKLLSLKMGICTKITDSGLFHVGIYCPKLTQLDLYRCTAVTDVGIMAVANGCLGLEMINMAYCEKVTDSSLRCLSKCLRLTALEIRGCTRLSSGGLSAIAEGCRKLTLLDIKKCCNIDDAGMLALAQCSQSLQQINISYCSVTDIGLMALASINHLHSMTILHVTGLTASGLGAALLACQGLRKVKLHSTFKASMPQALLNHVEARGCIFHWRNKAFQVDIDPKGWQL